VKNIFHILLAELEENRPTALATILVTKGSVPQVPGASAIFSARGLLAGTLGGGILEGNATRRARKISETGSSAVYSFDLNADFSSEEGAICGGTAIMLLDANPERSKDVFSELDKSIQNNKPGILATFITGQNEVKIERHWFEQGIQKEKHTDYKLKSYTCEMATCLEKRDCLYLKISDTISLFLQPVYPLSKLIIAGAGHIGRALSHMANLLDFEVTVIDDRPEYANQENLPDADYIIVNSIGKALREVPKTSDTYLIIVTRGHNDDAEAARACIGSNVPYIGMIGSKKKIQLMRENFISLGWATAFQLDQIHAPVGLEIGSKTVQEIALSICAQLIQIRNEKKGSKNNGHITAIILAAGESRRMGKPKLLLPFGDTSIIEKVVSHAARSPIDKIIVVLGSNNEAISQQIQDYPVETVYNKAYKEGMLSSVQSGLRTVQDITDAVMVLLADQPMISDTVLNGMVETYKKSDKEIIVASHMGKRGHPILFGHKYLNEVMKFNKENSLKDLLHKYPDDIEEMNTGSSEILRDIDTEKDYKEELKHQNNHD